MLIEFTKMHGLGNDFMVLNLVTQSLELTPLLVRLLGDRHKGIGFDQLLVAMPPSTPEADFRYRIFNQDGSEVEQCGNGARCFMAFVQAKRLTQKQRLVVETKKGLITLTMDKNGWVQVDMGKPKFAPEEIPFAPKTATKTGNLYRLALEGGEVVSFYVVNMGNPHAVVLVDDVLTVDVARQGRAIQASGAFLEGVNVGFMQVVNNRHIRLRVFERGVGETQACGSGACAAVAIGVREALLDSGRKIRAELFGGSLVIRYEPGYSLIMSGPATFVYEGVFSPGGLANGAGVVLDV